MRVVWASTSRRTGTTVLLIDNRDGSFEAFGEEQGGIPGEMGWATLCEDHGNFVVHGSRKLAVSFMPVPDQFCGDCEEIVSSRDD